MILKTLDFRDFLSLCLLITGIDAEIQAIHTWGVAKPKKILALCLLNHDSKLGILSKENKEDPS